MSGAYSRVVSMEKNRSLMNQESSLYLKIHLYMCCLMMKKQEYIEFLKLLDDKYPKGDKIRLVLDNLKIHTSEATRKYLATVPGRFKFVFTPKHGSWLNMVEGFFSKMTRQMLRGIRVKSKEELTNRIYRYFAEINEEPIVFHWKYNLDDIDVSEEIIVDTLPVKKSS